MDLEEAKQILGANQHIFEQWAGTSTDLPARVAQRAREFFYGDQSPEHLDMSPGAVRHAIENKQEILKHLGQPADVPYDVQIFLDAWYAIYVEGERRRALVR